MELLDAIYSRRAVREFTEDDVEEAQLRALIDAAIQAPSAVNRQPWCFSVVRDRALLARISREAKAHMLRSSPAALISHHFEQLLSDEAFDIFYHAPALIVISSVEDGPWAVPDCALAAQNLMLAARDAMLGSCWIGFAQGWLGTSEGKAALELPAGCVPVAPIIVGHPKVKAMAPVPRKAPEIHWIG
ncbi:nitroreductase [Sphingomonas oligophenolica]|uniref:Nitroreductase n=1 Tax=Sphingomonas oligophenolica TaxID=301154 RepID=A0ABU9Y8D9_9SPHN